jgi:competence protein ComEA
MRSRRSGNDQVAEVARRRLELLSAELAGLRSDREGPAWPEDRPDPEPRQEQPAPRHSGGLPGRHAHRSVGVLGLAAGWLQDRLPPALQGRVRMSAAHVVVVTVLAVAGAAVTGWWVARADGGGTVVPLAASAPSAAPVPGASSGAVPGSGAVSPLVGTGPTSAVTATASAGPGGAVPPPGSIGAPAVGGAVPTGTGGAQQSAPTGSIVVDVTGKVRRPGIATLPLGARVVDAVEAAGGARRGARLGSLNLARVLVDGEQVVVGVPAPPGLAASAASAPTAGSGAGPAGGTGRPLVNINTASQTQLEELPGVGPVTARSILDFRAENGAFTSVEELLEVSGIGDVTLAELAPFVTL